MSDSITFRASFPPIQSAIKVGDRMMRVQLDIPESDIAKAVGLIALQGCVLEVSVRVEQSQTNGGTEAKGRTARSPLNVAGG
jgi:hypothetical protein